MVSNVALSYMIISIFVTFVVVLGVFIYYRKKEKINIKPVIVGAIAFILFSQVLEKGLHFVVMKNNFFQSTLAFTLYGAFAAGIFEECGRFIMFKTVLRDKHNWKDGIAFGIGQGGIEAILIGIVTTVNYIVVSLLINSGTFEQSLGSKLPAEAVTQLKTLLTGPETNFLAIGVERTFALIMQIALSVVVLYAVKNRKAIFLFLAILLHAAMDIPAALYQMKIVTNLWVVEGMFCVYAVIALIYIIKSKKFFNKDSKEVLQNKSY